MPRPCLRDLVPPCHSDSPHPPAIDFYTYIYSNDGNTLLWSLVTHNSAIPRLSYTLLFLDNDAGKGIYFIEPVFMIPQLAFSMENYKGLATSPNATEAEILPSSDVPFVIGSEQTTDLTFYVVSGGSAGSILNVTYNFTKIIDSLEVTLPVSVTYNGNTIATLNAGDTKTLQCNGKVMTSDIVIGGKTLQCNGKLMASNVVVEVSGAEWEYPVQTDSSLLITQVYNATQNGNTLILDSEHAG